MMTKEENSGFTLVEIIVSMAIFAVVAVVAAGALLKIIDANKKAQSIQAAMTNLNFALETMSRELRVGSRYNCDAAGSLSGRDNGMTLMSGPCTADASMGGAIIAFKSSEPATNGTLSPTICTSPAFNLAYAYRFIEDSNKLGTYRLQKAEQSTGCYPSVSPIVDTDFHDIVSADNVTITDYNINVLGGTGNQQYPLASIRISGFAGVTEKDKTYFDVQTAASARLP